MTRGSLRTSDVGLEHGGVDVDVEVHGVLEERRHALELRLVPQHLRRNALFKRHLNAASLLNRTFH